MIKFTSLAELNHSEEQINQTGETKMVAPVLKRTSSVSIENGIKCLVYGHAGSGKTTLASTLKNPLVLSAESGLLSLSGHDIPYIEINSLDSLRDAHDFCASKEANGFDFVLDSISEISEIVLAFEKANTKDPRQAYGATQEKISAIIRAFRDMRGNVVFLAKCEKAQDELGKILYSPMLTGNKLGQMVPYFFDFVFPLRVERTADGEPYRVLQTDGDGSWLAKSRNSAAFKLDMWCEPNLSKIFDTINGAGK